jgi:hypothetical protein
MSNLALLLDMYTLRQAEILKYLHEIVFEALCELPLDSHGELNPDLEVGTTP